MSGDNQNQREIADGAARAEAAERLLRSQAAGVELGNDLETAAWRRENAANDAAFRHVTQAWDDLVQFKSHPAYAEFLGTPTLRERVVAAGRWLAEGLQWAPTPRSAFASALAVMILAGAWFFIPQDPQYVTTQIAEVRDVPLNDGSVVTLGARSSLNVTGFTNTVRTVRLASGEAFFSIAHDTIHPFVVLAGDARIRVVGTKFNVRYDRGQVRVSVLEGIVEVMHADGSAERTGETAAPAQMVRLTAGQQLAVTNTALLPAPVTLQGASPGAWREGRLDYQDAPLSEIVADANRYRSGEIRIASRSLAAERLTTSFRTTQIDQMLATLPETLSLTVQHNPDGTIDLLRRD